MNARRFVTVGALALVAAFAPITGAAAATTVQNFDTTAVNTLPTGCSAPSGGTAAIVSDVRSASAPHSLRINDQSTSTIVGMQCPFAARTGADVSFKLYPQQLASGFLYTLQGHVEGISTVRSVFHFNVTPQGAVRWYDGLGWTQISPAGTVALDAWTTLRVQVPTSQEVAYLYANGTYIGEAGGWGVRKVTDLTGYQFTSNGTATYGDLLYVDDVGVGDAVNSPPATSRPFTVGTDVTVAQSGTHLQMPNTAVNVTVNGQQQTLVSYPAHTDASDTAGNRLSVTTDNGTTWSDAQSRNPLPDAPSYGLTKLANGDILAVDYHTYMTPDSGNLKAQVPTAVSHDGGQSWTQRAGVMTAPQAMRPIAGVTDRPGSPLGGFVLVHSVVQSPDGSLLQSGYGYYQNDTKYRQIVLRSTDGGVNWTLIATVAYNPTLSSEPRYEGFDEGAIERTADGRLLIVMRTGSYQQMYASRSSDNGATWTAPTPMVTGPNSLPLVGIFPTLTRVPSGKLVLWVGRPGQRLLVSNDGNGTAWTTPQAVDYRNSGNGTFIPVGTDQLLTFGDRGADWANPQPLTYRVWSRLVTLTG